MPSKQAHRIRVEVVRHAANGTTGTLHDPQITPEHAAGTNAWFTILPMRWVVERTHAWTERWSHTVMHHDVSGQPPHLFSGFSVG